VAESTPGESATRSAESSDWFVPALPHEVWPAETLDDRVCGSCEDIHTYADHYLDGRWFRMRCGEPECKCCDFACYEHPDNECGETDD
jgi:hypothetical protein